MGEIQHLRPVCPGEILKSRRFSLPSSKQELVLSGCVLEIFSEYRQTGTDPEAGGLLFAEFDLPVIRIVEASRPNPSDKRWRTLFIPNRILQRRLIKKCFKKNWHFVGEWHTHPEPYPTPSHLDLDSMADAFRKSQHELNHFIMVIVGNRTDDLELWVSTHNGSQYHRLNEFRSETTI